MFIRWKRRPALRPGTNCASPSSIPRDRRSSNGETSSIDCRTATHPFDANCREAPRMPSYDPVSGIVLAGGRSRRMGGLDKRWAIVDGRSLLERAIRSLQHWCDEVLVVAALGEELTLAVPGVRVVNDRFAAGPLGGLEAGLRSMRSPCAVVVARDMPLPDSRLP